MGTWASTHRGHTAEAEERDADGWRVAGTGGEATGGHAHLSMLCVHIWRTGHSFFFCFNVESYGATKLTRQGTLAIHFVHITSSKDTSASPTRTVCFWGFFRTHPCDKTPTSRYVGAFAAMLSPDGLWLWLIFSFFHSSSLLKKVSVAHCMQNTSALRQVGKNDELLYMAGVTHLLTVCAHQTHCKVCASMLQLL